MALGASASSIESPTRAWRRCGLSTHEQLEVSAPLALRAPLPRARRFALRALRWPAAGRTLTPRRALSRRHRIGQHSTTVAAAAVAAAAASGVSKTLRRKLRVACGGPGSRRSGAEGRRRTAAREARRVLRAPAHLGVRRALLLGTRRRRVRLRSARDARREHSGRLDGSELGREDVRLDEGGLRGRGRQRTLRAQLGRHAGEHAVLQRVLCLRVQRMATRHQKAQRRERRLSKGGEGQGEGLRWRSHSRQ